MFRHFDLEQKFVNQYVNTYKDKLGMEMNKLRYQEKILTSRRGFQTDLRNSNAIIR